MADISKIKVTENNIQSTYNIKDASAVAGISRNGSTYTVTKRDGTTDTFDQQTYSPTIETITLPVANGATSVIEVTEYNAGTAASLSKEDVSIPNVTDIGTSPSLTVPNTNYVATGFTKVKLGATFLNSTSFQNGTSASNSTTDYELDLSQVLVGSDTAGEGTRITTSQLSTLMTFAAGQLPTLGTAIAATKINDWTTNTPTSLTTATKSIPDISTTSKSLVTNITASN